MQISTACGWRRRNRCGGSVPLGGSHRGGVLLALDGAGRRRRIRRVRRVPVRCVQVDERRAPLPRGPGDGPDAQLDVGLDVLRSCSIKHQMASVIFSLEMSKTEIVMRLLSAEAKIKLANAVGPDERRRLDAAGRRMSEISEAPLSHRRFAEPDDDGDPGEGPPAVARRPGSSSSSSTTCS